MPNRKDTRTSPLQGRDRLAPSQMTRIGNGIRCAAPTLEPQDETDGVPVIDWSSVHVIFYSDRPNSTGMFARVRAWRWYAKQRDGQSGAGGDEVGRWIFDCDTIVALDPALAANGRGAHHVWQTRGCEKMYWQVVSIQLVSGDEPHDYPWVMIQPFGFSRNDEPHAISTFDTGCGGEDPSYDPCCPQDATRMASLDPTHWSPNDGTVTYLGASTLTAAGFPFVVDDSNCYITGIIVRKAANLLVEYINGHDGIAIAAAAGTITISGVTTPFAVGDMDYYVYMVYQEKAYTEATDSLRTEENQPLNHELTQPAYIINDLAVVAGPVNIPGDNGIVMDGYKDIQFQIHIVGGQSDGHVNRVATLKFQGSNDVAIGGVREWVDLAVGYDLGSDSTMASWTSTGLTAVDAEIDFDNWMGKRIRAVLSFDTAPHADHPGACVITERRKAL